MIIPRGRVDLTDKAVLITGCDTGFGLLLAKQLDELGVHVFAGIPCTYIHNVIIQRMGTKW